MTKLAQSIYRFLSLPTPVWNKVFLEFWVKLDVFIVLTESFIESYVNQTCKHTEFFEIWCSVIFLKLAAVIYCFPLFLFCPVSLTVCAESCRSMCLCLLRQRCQPLSKFFFFFFLAGVVWNDGKTSPNHLLHMVARKEKLKLWRWN